MISVTVISSSGESTVYVLQAAPSILVAFENAGFQYPHGCRVGVCGGCISEVLAGGDDLPAPDYLERQRLTELQAAEQQVYGRDLPAGNLRFPCRTALTASVTLRPLSGSVSPLPPRPSKT